MSGSRCEAPQLHHESLKEQGKPPLKHSDLPCLQESAEKLSEAAMPPLTMFISKFLLYLLKFNWARELPGKMMM
jgi:hypothetical protein